MKKRVLGIFTCFNRKEKTLACIKGLAERNTEVDIHFIAVDDKSVDGTVEALEKISFVKVICGQGNLYYTGGMREGMKYAKAQKSKYDYVLLFNDDVEFYSDTLERLVERLSGNENRILVGPTCGNDGNLSYGGVKKKSRFRPSFEIVMSKKKRSFCDTFNGNCVLLPWEIFEAVPIMDEHYTHSLGDFAYGLSLRQMGYEIEVVDFFVGVCDDNLAEGTWRDPNVPKIGRAHV